MWWCLRWWFVDEEAGTIAGAVAHSLIARDVTAPMWNVVCRFPLADDHACTVQLVGRFSNWSFPGFEALKNRWRIFRPRQRGNLVQLSHMIKPCMYATWYVTSFPKRYWSPLFSAVVAHRTRTIWLEPLHIITLKEAIVFLVVALVQAISVLFLPPVLEIAAYRIYEMKIRAPNNE